MVGLLGVADLANNLASSAKGLAVAFGLANPEPKFPEFKDQGITSDFQREHWYKNPSQGLYAFSVEPVGTGTVSEFPAAVENIKSLFTSFFDDSGFTFGEFKLPITPQEITQTEDFAVSIKPTQGGTVVNHSGNKYKTLSISGTTGVQPFRGLLGAFKGTGLAIGKPDELQYRSGYEVFQHFRQWMRAYHEVKAQPKSQGIRMMFRNYKDWEFLYVEPLKFTMKRDAQKPLLYNYTISFKVLGVHSIDKPLFDQVVSKLNEISVAVANTYVLIKKNKSVTEFYTGTIDDFEQSINNLKYALKAANKDDIKMSEFSKSDAKKLSFKETLSLLGVIGNAMSASAANQKQAEAAGTSPASADPAAAGLGLTTLAAFPSYTNAQSAQAQLNAILDQEPALLSGIPLSALPPPVAATLVQNQTAAALISPVEVLNIQSQAQGIADQLAEGLGLGDDSYNAIFGITPSTGIETAVEVTDAQFEMLYAMSQAVNSIDGILSSDKLFDTNAALYSQAGAANGANSVGQGIFSMPDPNAGTKDGFLSAGQTLEDLALSELGDASRWTEIAELNGLKAPYIVGALETLNPNYIVESANFADPTTIADLQIGFLYLVPSTPSPSSGWSGKSKYIAEYLGGDESLVASWRFFYPDEGTLIKITSTQELLRFTDGEWSEVDESIYSTDGVLKPGDKIKIPSSAAKPLTTPIQGPRDNLYTNGLSSGERSLAVDLRLTEDMDLDLTPSGDLNVAFGADNGAQAIVLKLLYEKGSLKKYPGIGTNLTPGKVMPDIANLRADLTASLLQDTRIKKVSKINLIQENSGVTLSFEVSFNDIAQPIPINIPI